MGSRRFTRRATVSAAAIALCSTLTTHAAFAAPSPQVPAPATASPQVPTAEPSPAPVGEPAPAAVEYAVPGISQVAQPVQTAAPQVQSVPEIQYVQGEPQIVYVDREVIVDREVQVVEENGTLLFLDPAYQNQINPAEVADSAVGNYAAYDQRTKDTLNLTAGAAALGATGGAVAGGTVGAVGTALTGAAAGGIAGAAAAPLATAPLCAVGGILIPAVGGLGCVVSAAATGAAGGAIVGAAAGAGAGLVAGSAIGAGAGAAGAASLVPGGTEAVQNLAADTAWDTENDLRTSNGFRGLVGDKPSGLEGDISTEESTETRIVEGTTLDAAGQNGRHASGEEAPVADQQNDPRHAAVDPAPELPTPYQDVYDTVSDIQTAANDLGAQVGQTANAAVDQAKQDFADFAQSPSAPNLLPA